MDKPNCYLCVHRRWHTNGGLSSCLNVEAKPVFQAHSSKVRGSWPSAFSPAWIYSCDGFTREEAGHG